MADGSSQTWLFIGFGSLSLYSGEPGYFSETDAYHFNKLAENIVYGIVALQTRSDRFKAEDNLTKSLEKLRKTLGAIIEALENTVEVRDPYTAGHQRRVADLSRSIATQMGFSEDIIDGIRIGGILHDIGKINVPIDILIEAKILSVADVVEAMAFHRPYRPALGVDKALEEISDKKGSLYNCEAVDACIGLFNTHGYTFGS